MTITGLAQSVQAFQTALGLRLAGGAVEPVLKFYSGLSAVNLRAFADLTEASFLVRCVLDARVLEEAFARLDIHPRSIVGREVRPSRLLEAPRRETASATLVLTDSIHTRPASLLIKLLGEHPEVSLWVRRADGRRRKCPSSIISLLSLALRQGEQVTFEAEGDGAREITVHLERINSGGWRRWENTEELKTPAVLPSTVTLTLQGITTAADKAMREFGTGELCAILDPETKRLYFGRPEWGHGGTALTAGLVSIHDYARINFRRTGTGAIAAYFPGNIPFENFDGYLVLRKILRMILLPGASALPK